MEKQRRVIVRGFVAGLLGLILYAGIAWAAPSFDPHTAQGGLPQCKVDLATCITSLTQIQSNCQGCLNDLKGYAADLSTCEADLAACLQTVGVQRTGQTQSYGSRDDGALQMGLMWQSPRFIDNNNGTVVDTFTGLIWTQNANLFLRQLWGDALASCNSLASGIDGLSDGSKAGDWRLPNVRELQTLIDYSHFNPALPTGHPFVNVQTYYYYWSSTTYVGYGYSIPYYGWLVSLNNGSTINDDKRYSPNFVWCVRGGQ